MKDLETDIVELEHLSESTGNRGYIESLKGKKMALADVMGIFASMYNNERTQTCIHLK